MTQAEPLLVARQLTKIFPASAGALASARLQAVVVDGVSLEIARGETLGIVGESGSGKTTLARMLLRLIEPDSGQIEFEGRNWLAARGGELPRMRRKMQMVFQDPGGSLNPRMRATAILGEPLAIHERQLTAVARRERVAEMLRAVGLESSAGHRYPHEFSGGQRQRIAIARALMLRPALLIADEPVSALDVSVGAQILELLVRLQREFDLAMLLISHSFAVVAQLASRVAVMRAGKFVEVGPADQVLRAPAHPYTQALLEALPALPALLP